MKWVILPLISFILIFTFLTGHSIATREYEKQLAATIAEAREEMDNMREMCAMARLHAEGYRMILVQMGVDMEAADHSAYANTLR